jgi:hypothetical protein
VLAVVNSLQISKSNGKIKLVGAAPYPQIAASLQPQASILLLGKALKNYAPTLL